MTRWRLCFAVSANEAALHRARIRDLDDISDFIRDRNPHAAARVSATILESLNMLTHFPMLGRSQSVSGVRKVVTRRYGYLAYYRIDEAANEVIILTIQHPARDRKFGDA